MYSWNDFDLSQLKVTVTAQTQGETIFIQLHFDLACPPHTSFAENNPNCALCARDPRFHLSKLTSCPICYKYSNKLGLNCAKLRLKYSYKVVFVL